MNHATYISNLTHIDKNRLILTRVVAGIDIWIDDFLCVVGCVHIFYIYKIANQTIGNQYHKLKNQFLQNCTSISINFFMYQLKIIFMFNILLDINWFEWYIYPVYMWFISIVACTIVLLYQFYQTHDSQKWYINRKAYLSNQSIADESLNICI